MPEKIIWQIENNQDLEFSYIISSDSEEVKSIKNELIDFCNKNDGVKPIANFIHKSNDAVPSWSGFNYQGMMMMLRVLEKINENSNKKNFDFSLFEVELEKYEDFIIYEDNKPIEIYQVKAMLSTIKTYDYLEAIKKLLLHRKQLEASEADCYLVSASEIEDWDTFPEKEDVKLFKYQKNTVQVIKVADYVKEEIEQFYELKGRSSEISEVELAFNYLCQEIDNLIADLHHNKNGNYKISFGKFVEILENTIKESMINKITYTKLKVQKHIQESLSISLESICNDCSKTSCTNCIIRELPSIFENIDQNKYAKILEPTKKADGHDFKALQAYDATKLEELFEQFYHMDTSFFGYDENHLFINSTEEYPKFFNKIIPTNLSLTKLKLDKGIASTMKGIEKNKDILEIINNSSITASMSKDEYSYRDEKVYGNIETKEDNNSIFQNLNFKIINKDIVINEFEEESDE